jgi:transcriptional regulator with XRE-family HTH domain
MVRTKGPERPLHFLKEWREFRNMTGEQLANAVNEYEPGLNTNKGTISLLEGGARPEPTLPGAQKKRAQRLSDKWAKRLAAALKTTPGMLLDHDPNTLGTDILEIWGNIPDDVKPQALTILETFRRAQK